MNKINNKAYYFSFSNYLFSKRAIFRKNILLINKLSFAAFGNISCCRLFAHELFFNFFFWSKIKQYGAACYRQCKVLFPDKNIRFILSPYPYKNKLCIVISRFFLNLDEFNLCCWFCFNLPYLWEILIYSSVLQQNTEPGV